MHTITASIMFKSEIVKASYEVRNKLWMPAITPII